MHQQHWPKPASTKISPSVGIAADIGARCPDLKRGTLAVTLAAYARRIGYLESVVAGAVRVDLDGNAAGEVTAKEAEYPAGKSAS